MVIDAGGEVRLCDAVGGQRAGHLRAAGGKAGSGMGFAGGKPARRLEGDAVKGEVMVVICLLYTSRCV